MENKNSNNGIGGGFLLGLLIGILIALLFTTKKGREILRELIDKVTQKLSHNDESLEKIKEEQGIDEENDYVKPTPEEVKKEVRYLAAESPPENQVSDNNDVAETQKNHADEKNGKLQKLSKRLFFRKPQSKG